jgi:hypothetical protein
MDDDTQQALERVALNLFHFAEDILPPGCIKLLDRRTG